VATATFGLVGETIWLEIMLLGEHTVLIRGRDGILRPRIGQSGGFTIILLI
jgi:hypothetical protein